jgi:hypothetical protein
MQDYKALPFDDLRTLHREIGALIAQRRHETLEQLKLIFNSAIYEVIDRQQQSAPRRRLGTTFQFSLGSG